MTKFRSLAAALALAFLSLGPAHADTTAVPMTGAWLPVASAGTAALEIQNQASRTAVAITTSASTPSLAAAPALVLLPNEKVCWIPSIPIYALGTGVGSVAVTTNTGCVPTAGGGGGGGGSTTVNQGTAGSSAWPVSWSGQSVGVSNLPALVAGTAHVGAVNIDNFPASQIVTFSGQSVGVTALPATPAGTAHVGSVNVDNFPATQPVSAASLPLPAGAATAANQTSEQSAAGTAASTLVGIQGAGTSALPLNDNLTQVAGSAVQTGTGTSGAGVPRVTVASDSSVSVSNLVGGYVAPIPSNNSSAAALPATANAATALQVYGAGGSFYGGYAQNYAATAGWLIAYNGNSAPATGALSPTLVLDCARLPASGSAQIGMNVFGKRYSAGIILLVSSGADCVTYTTGTITAFIAGMYR